FAKTSISGGTKPGNRIYSSSSSPKFKYNRFSLPMEDLPFTERIRRRSAGSWFSALEYRAAKNPEWQTGHMEDGMVGRKISEYFTVGYLNTGNNNQKKE